MRLSLGLGLPPGGNGIPALDLSFLNSETLSSQITFTRASTATRVNSSGVIVSAAIDEPRYDYDPATLAAKGLLIEEQRTNLLLRSAEFDNASWTKTSATVSANAASGPDNTTSADKVIVNNGVSLGASTAGGVKQLVSKAASAITYTLTVYAKAGELNRVGLFLANGAVTSSAFATFNLATGAVIGTPSTSGSFSSASATIEDAGSGFYRARFTATSDTDTIIRADFWPVDGTATIGDGTSGIYVWGAQLEAGAFGTSYVPTTSSQVTRSLDVAKITGAAFSGWWNGAEGTVILEYLAAQVVAGGNSVIAQISDSGNTNRYQFLNDNAGQIAVLTSSVSQGAIDAGTLNAGSSNRLAYAIKANDTALSLNGGAAVVDTSVTLPSVDRLTLGATVTSQGLLNGHIRSIRYYRQRLPNTQLQALTL